MVFAPEVLAFDVLLMHDFARSRSYRASGQYRSALFPSNADQIAQIANHLATSQFESNVIAPATPEARFWDAEDYHQKYMLRRDRTLTAKLARVLGPRWDESTLATKLNARGVAGFDAAPWRLHLAEHAGDSAAAR